MQKPDDAILLIQEHLISVCMDLVEYGDDDEEDVRTDFEELLMILLESLQLKVSATSKTKTGKEFTCKITIPQA